MLDGLSNVELVNARATSARARSCMPAPPSSMGLQKALLGLNRRPAAAAPLLLLLAALLLGPLQVALAQQPSYPVSRNDLVVAIPVDDAHTTVAKAGRAWRKVLATAWRGSRSAHAALPPSKGWGARAAHWRPIGD